VAEVAKVETLKIKTVGLLPLLPTQGNLAISKWCDLMVSEDFANTLMFGFF